MGAFGAIHIIGDLNNIINKNINNSKNFLSKYIK